MDDLDGSVALPHIRRIAVGREKRRLICVDGLAPELMKDAHTAAADAPFASPSFGYYPGLRAELPLAFTEALRAIAAPIMRQEFDLGPVRFETLDASFSLATTPPEDLTALQSVPHIDTPDPARFALLIYLCDQSLGGTAFYRQKATGFETVTPDRMKVHLIARDRAIADGWSPEYVGALNPHFERILTVPARFGRCLIYPSNLLHSGDIPDPHRLSADPSLGRLTLNIFVEARPSSNELSANDVKVTRNLAN